MNSARASRTGGVEGTAPTMDFTQGYGSFDLCPRTLADYVSVRKGSAATAELLNPE